MANLFKKHWAVIVLALLTSFMVVLPTLRSLSHLNDGQFKGIYPVFNADKMFYMSLTQDVYEGYWGLGNAYVFEHKNEPYIQPPLAEIILSMLVKVLNLNIPQLFFVLDFIFPAIIVMVLYFIFLGLTKSRLISAGFVLWHAIIFLPHYAMPLNPQFSFIPFFVGLYFIVNLYIQPELKNNQQILYSSLAGLMTVILVYLYPFFWTSLFVLFFFSGFFFYFFAGRDIRYLKIMIYFTVPFVIFALPYLFNLLRAIKLPYYLETVSRYGLFNSHIPSAFYNIATLFIVAIALVISKRLYFQQTHWYFSLCLVFSGVILNWQNVVTGKFMQFSSHYQRTTVIFSMIIIALMLYNMLRVEGMKARKVIVFALILLFVLQAGWRQYKPVAKWFATYSSASEMSELQEYASLFAWLNQNTAADSVVYSASGELANLMTIYTRNNSYLPYYGAVNLMSDDEVENRWLSKTIFDDRIDGDYIKNADIWVNKYIDEYQNGQVRKKLFGLIGINFAARNRRVPIEVSLKFLTKYEDYKKGAPQDSLNKYRLDYLIISDKEVNWREQRTAVEEYIFFRFEKKLGHFYIYRKI